MNGAPSPQISPDGKFYWDGQRWVPMAASQKRGYPGRGLIVGCLATLVLGAGAVLAVGALHGQGHTIKGTMTVHESVGSGSCTGTGGYSDIHVGTEVVVKDETGKVLATSALGDGQVESATCVFPFALPNVPDANFYEVEVSHRGNVTYSKASMEATGWNVSVELGG